MVGKFIYSSGGSGTNTITQELYLGITSLSSTGSNNHISFTASIGSTVIEIDGNDIRLATGVLPTNGGVSIVYDIIKNDYDADGTFFICGEFEHYNGITASNICKLDRNLQIDTSFSVELDSVCYTIFQDSNGDLLLGGSFNSINGVSAVGGFGKVDSSGVVNATFSQATIFDGSVRKIGEFSNNNIMILGDFTTYNSSSAPYSVLIDPSTNLVATFSFGYPSCLVLNNADEMIIGGALIVGTAGVGKIDNSGTVDAGYLTSVGNVTALACYGDDRVLASELIPWVGSNYALLSRIEPDGAPDIDFNRNAFGGGILISDNTIYDVEITGGDEILISGAFNNIFYSPSGFISATYSINGISKLQENCGDISTEFDIGTGFDYFVYNQSDGATVFNFVIDGSDNINCAGYFNRYNNYN